jgi:hypothetical protein
MLEILFIPDLHVNPLYGKIRLSRQAALFSQLYINSILAEEKIKKNQVDSNENK